MLNTMRSPPARPFPHHRLGWLSLGLALLLTACPPPPPPPPAELHSQALGTVNLHWLTSNSASQIDSSGRVKFTPLVYSDLDDISSATRYLSMTFAVDNLSAEPLENLSLRAIARPENLGGTAVFDLRCAPSAANCPADELLTDPSLAQQIRPIQGTVLRSGPSPDANASSFMAYRASESATLTTEARAAGLLTDPVTALDYGFTARDYPQTGRVIAAGTQGYITVAVRLPRRFTGIATPYSFQLSFLVTTDDTLRVSRALGESTDQALSRASALGTAARSAELVLLGSDTDAPTAPNVTLLRLENARIGLAPTLLIAP